MARTRVKICGITRPDDLHAALAAGADAIGFVFYPPSPRFVDIQRAAALIKRVPPFVACVGLFVNAEPHAVADVLAAMPLDLLQFHGDEDVRYCERFSKPYVKAARMAPGLDLVEFTRTFASAQESCWMPMSKVMEAPARRSTGPGFLNRCLCRSFFPAA